MQARAAPRRASVATAGLDTQNDLDLGDIVEVPGGNRGTVKYIGTIEGKNGLFAGVELSRDSASFGKNNGDVDGVQYFTCSIQGAGIFLPTYRATKIASSQTPPGLSSPPPNASLPSFRSPPSTPSLPKFSQSVGPGSRNPFSQTVGPAARAQTPQTKGKPRPSLPRPGSPSKAPTAALGRPTVGGFRTPSSPAVSRLQQKPSTPIPVRTQSRAQSRLDDVRGNGASTPTTAIRPGAASRALSNTIQSRPDETRRLQAQLDEKERQLADQAASIAEMETALAELQSMVADNTRSDQQNARDMDSAGNESVLAELQQLKDTVAEKNDRIGVLTAEFDSHRRDFRETISALESASSETERVYEAKLREVMEELEELRASNEDMAAREGDLAGSREDMETVATHLQQLEDMVEGLEEGLGESRRNEAEAKQKVEELEGELERALLALEQEKSWKVSSPSGDEDAPTQRLQQEKDELKEELQRRDEELKELSATFRQLELNAREHDLRSSEKVEELVSLRATLQGLQEQSSVLAEENKHLKENLEVANKRHADFVSSNRNAATPSPTRSLQMNRGTTGSLRSFGHDSPHALASLLHSRHMQESTEATNADDIDVKDDLYCDLCETEGHDVLSCTAAVDQTSPRSLRAELADVDGAGANEDFLSSKNLPPLGSAHHSGTGTPNVATSSSPIDDRKDDETSAYGKSETAMVYDPNASGPAPGKRSGKIDLSKYCAFCELDGHESLDCPFEDEL